MIKEECEIETSKAIMEMRNHIAELEKENAELKEEVSFLEDNLRVARKDREDLQLDVAKGLKEFVKDYPATAFRYLANEKYVEQLTEAKELLRMVIDSYNHKERFSFEKDLIKAEQFISEGEKGMTENSNVPECPSIKIGCDKMYYVDVR